MKIYHGKFLREDDLKALGAQSVGRNVAVHESCVLVGLENVSFGDNVRIDPYTLVSGAGGWVRFGDFIHVGSHCSVSGGSGVEFGDFSGLSAGVRIFSRSDDYGGRYLTNPTVPAEFTNPPAAQPVRLGRHVIIGAGAIILPEVSIGEGTAVGALAVVQRDLEPWTIYAGVPARAVRPRNRDLLAKESDLKRAMAAAEVTLPVSHL